MKAWQRRSSLGGPRIKSVMEPHEVHILHTLVSNVMEMLEERRDSAPRDELAELTGMRSKTPDPAVPPRWQDRAFVDTRPHPR